MQKNLKKKLLAILLVTIFSFYISLPNNKNLDFYLGGYHFQRSFNLKLGLDLIGGSHLVFEADTSSLPQDKKQEALDSLKNIVEKRVNLYGVSEPNIQLSNFEEKERIIVELPGVNDPNEAIKLVGQTAQLVFAQVDENNTLSPTTLTGADLKSSQVSFDNVSGKPVVILEFINQGAQKFADLTEKNVGKSLPILLDNQIISAPVVQDKITGGSAQISGNFTLDEAKNLSIELNAGALPIPIKIASENTVGASLGKESVQKSIKAGLYGLIGVFIFMIIFYGKLGVVADIGLVIFGLVSLALYKIIPVVLTLPGIAGFLLSVGMAVDSNILIFERFREEKAKGTNIYYALETAFGRAWDSIRDANISTLTTAFILANPFSWSFLHTSGPVRGFALTLALGIVISLFTGIFVSRNLLRLIIKEKNERN